MDSDLFDRVVATTRLSPLVGPFTVRRILVRADILPPESVTSEQLRSALPAFRTGLAVYLDDHQLPAVLGELEALASRFAP